MSESVRRPARLSDRCGAGIGVLLVVLSFGEAGAATVRPVDFESLCERAAVIFRGRVVAVQAVRRDGAVRGAPIVTEVGFAVERILKGDHPEREVTLTLPGGSVDGRTLAVPGVPTFAVGERAILFVARDGVAFVPTVGIDQGVFRIEHDDALGGDVIAPADARRLRRAEARMAGVRNRRERFAVGTGPLPLETFEESIDDVVE